MKKICLAFVLFLSASTVLFGEELTKESVKTVNFKSGGDVVIRADEGEVVVDTWSKPEVRIKMTKRAWARSKREAEKLIENLRVDINSFGHRIIISVRELRHRNITFSDLFRASTWRYGSQVDFEITVPENSNLKVSSDEGNIRIYGVSGKIKVDADEGDINISNITSEMLSIQADEGDVEITGIKESEKGFIKIDVDEGDVNISDTETSELDVSCDEGRISFSDSKVKRFWFYTDEGDVYASFVPEVEGIYEIKTDEGDVSIIIPETSEPYLYLKSEDGEIYSDFTEQKSRDEDEVIIKTRIGEGKSRIKVYTEEGSIKLRRK